MHDHREYTWSTRAKRWCDASAIYSRWLPPTCNVRCNAIAKCMHTIIREGGKKCGWPWPNLSILFNRSWGGYDRWPIEWLVVEEWLDQQMYPLLSELTNHRCPNLYNQTLLPSHALPNSLPPFLAPSHTIPFITNYILLESKFIQTINTCSILVPCMNNSVSTFSDSYTSTIWRPFTTLVKKVRVIWMCTDEMGIH